MIGGQRLANAEKLATDVPLRELAWTVYTYIEARQELDPILERAAAICLILGGEPMPPVTGGIEGELTGRVYPLVVGLKTGPRTMHLCGKGTTYQVRELGGSLVLEVSEPTEGGKPNLLIVPYENVAFIAEPLFLAENPPK